MANRRIIIVGEVGAGKTELVNTLSSIKTIKTEEKSTVDIGKEFTTVGIDYGRIIIDEEVSIDLYGMPGQERFSFLWESFKESTWLVVALVKAQKNTNYDNLIDMIDFFHTHSQDHFALLPRGLQHFSASIRRQKAKAAE